MQKFGIKFLSIIIISFLFTISCSRGDKDLALQKFYSGNIFLKKKSSSSEKSSVQAEVEPQMGWRTGGNPAQAPTKVAADGFSLILNNDVNGAKEHAKWLMEHSITKENAVFFPFNFGFQPYYPYKLTPPWPSGITQGLSLALFSYLYKETGDKEYLLYAEKIFRSYSVPIEKGGFTRFEAEGPFFEEYPTKIPTRVLNGALVAMLALHDYAVISGNSEADALFKNSTNRFKSLLEKYEVVDPDTNSILSAYSLAPARTEVLGRFLGEGNIRIYSLKLIGEDKNGKKTEISTVQVGSDEDEDVMNGIYIWAGNHMNWGGSNKRGSNHFREVNGHKGQYNHSPFKFVLATSPDYVRYGVEVDWETINPGKMQIQLFDGKEYHLLGIFKAGSNRTRTLFYLSDMFMSSFNNLNDNRPKIDNKYLDDNYELVEMLGKITGEKTFMDFAERWRGSFEFVPARWINKFPPSILKPTTEEILAPIAGSSESKGLESPSVLKINGTYYMYYSAYNDSGESNIFLATSSDGIKWIRHGMILSRVSNPSKLSGSLSNPTVIENTSKGDEKKYLIFFRASILQRPGYDRICWASSNDGFHWTYGGEIFSMPSSSLTVSSNPDSEGFVMFFFRPGCDNVLFRSISPDGKKWSTPMPIAEINGQKAAISGLSALNFQQKLFLTIQSLNKLANRHETSFYLYMNGKLEPTGKNNLNIDRDWEGKWYSIRTGYSFLNENEKILAYFVGYSTLNSESGGRIGRSEVDLDVLKNYLRNL